MQVASLGKMLNLYLPLKYPYKSENVRGENTSYSTYLCPSVKVLVGKALSDKPEQVPIYHLKEFGTHKRVLSISFDMLYFRLLF